MASLCLPTHEATSTAFSKLGKNPGKKARGFHVTSTQPTEGMGNQQTSEGETSGHSSGEAQPSMFGSLFSPDVPPSGEVCILIYWSD